MYIYFVFCLMPEVTQAMQQGRLGPGPGWGRLGFAALLELPQASKKKLNFDPL